MIRGEKIVLRALEHGDLKQLAAWRNESRNDFFSPWPLALSEQEQWYVSYLGDCRQRMFIIETPRNADGNPIQKSEQAIGCIALCNIDWRNQSAEIGRVLIASEGDRSNGYGIDAVRRLVVFAFEDLNLHRVYVQLFGGNLSSAFYEKCGFQMEGLLRQAIWKNGLFRDVAIMARLRPATACNGKGGCHE